MWGLALERLWSHWSVMRRLSVAETLLVHGWLGGHTPCPGFLGGTPGAARRELAASAPPQSSLCPAWPHRKHWKTIFLLVFRNFYRYFLCSSSDSGPGDKVGPAGSGTGLSRGWGDGKPQGCLCASVRVAARKFKGALATYILYPLDRAPSRTSVLLHLQHQSLGDAVNVRL